VRRLYDAYFRIPKDDKIPDKVMLGRVVLMVTVVLCCLGGLSLSAYAWFSTGLTSSHSTLAAANFDLRITVSHNGNPIPSDADGAYTLTAGDTYGVYIEKLGEASTGFCLLTVGFSSGQLQYHTQQLGRDGQQTRAALRFDLQPAEDVTVKFTPRWGTSVLYGQEDSPRYVLDGSVKELAAPVVLTTPDPIAPTTAPTDPTPGEPGYVIHTVELGENLYMISLKYGSTVDAIVALNDIPDASVIYLGQQLKIPAMGTTEPTK